MDFVEQLNAWGAQKKPFLFLIDFDSPFFTEHIGHIDVVVINI